MGIKGFFKDAMKKRIPIDILSGGHILNEKQLPTGIQVATIIQGEERGEVRIEVPFGSKFEYILDGIEWEESARRSGGKAAGGAIVGTLVAGPLGGIAGAAVGGRRRDNSKAFIYVYRKTKRLRNLTQYTLNVTKRNIEKYQRYCKRKSPTR
ncbi:MAG TPA: hypothetical protein VEY70_03500 [Metabacillus sp.]|nr:hypothetical protein [Metabacillus sp.]